MRSDKLVNPNYDFNQILGALEDRAKGIVVDILGGVRRNLEQELKGVALEVMRAVKEFEIASIAGPKGKHQEDRLLKYVF